VNGALRSEMEKKIITYSRIHSASGSNTFDTRVSCVNGALRSDVEKKYSRIHSAGGSNTFDRRVCV
jgi:hypothetical protein